MFTISTQDLEPEKLKQELLDPASGGFVSFEGWVRNHHEGKAVRHLEYEAYPALAEKEGARIIREALEKFEIEKATCQHRTGKLEIGGLAVWVGVSAAHRDAAFEACRYIIDEVKVRVPIWKKETWADGSSEWVECTQCAQHAHPHQEFHTLTKDAD